jgi:hypothetical protein
MLILSLGHFSFGEIPENFEKNSKMSIKRVKERHLFIQMEYCRTTLRAVIDEGN